ncbi:hypothetical protein [Megamonas hypermegale]|uniref:hypothetical protein n=1 Tax=Megamonas hypermegale TaxID=158847 RepID=UPI0026E97888|nr:hypothetical protein [Megamonas hypermegale]
MNNEIEKIFKDFTVNGKKVPVSFLRYNGRETTYVTYQQVDADSEFSADDDLQSYVVYYDFDVYSKQNYLAITEAIKSSLKANGWRYQPGKSSGDLYEDETGYYHTTLNFSKEKGEITNG